MSKIKNHAVLTRSGTGCYIASCTYTATAGVKGSTTVTLVTSRHS